MDEIEVFNPPVKVQDVKRKIAQLLSVRGMVAFSSDVLGKRITYRQYLATMLWDLVTSGEALFADGTSLKVTEVKEWLDIVKFMAIHIDGPVTPATVIGQINQFKVYAGFNPDEV